MTEPILIGASRPMQRLRELVATIAPTRLAVLIEGETGSGKELVASLVHHRSKRRGTFVPFNVCALGDSMFEDALFGHVKGAFTGAMSDARGFLREADGGSAFFDEISGLPIGLQAKLLRAIETGVFRPIGAAHDVRSDFRVIAATNERLSDLVDAGRFRSDLRHRLSGVVIPVPSLAERVDDIPDLVHHFATRAFGAPAAVDGTALELLMSHDWPGNIRELKQVVDVAAAFAHGTIDVAAVEQALAHRHSHLAAARTDERVERRELVGALQRMAWDVGRTAAHLGVHRATMYRRMKRHGIEAPRVAPSRASERPVRGAVQ